MYQKDPLFQQLLNQIHNKSINDGAYDINLAKQADESNAIRSSCLKLVALLVALSTIAGGIALMEAPKSGSTPCFSDIHGDGFCDDRQNTAECDYDGLDCCIMTMDTQFCRDCTVNVI